MRIISGKLKGRRIDPPANLKLRPTTDRAKESLFNILANYVDFEDITVLDLFAGTGSISYEFISRGADAVVAVEQNAACVSFIGRMAGKMEMNELFIIRANVFKFLQQTNKKFDIIFADPPFDLPGLEKIPEIIFEKELLNPGGWLILEHGSEVDFSDNPNIVDHRVYSRVNFSFFFLKEE